MSSTGLVISGEVPIKQDIGPIRLGLTPEIPSNLPQAGRIQFCLKNWKQLTQDPWILDTVTGYKIPFVKEPPLTQLPPFSLRQEEVKIISKEIDSLLEKGAICQTTDGKGFTSNIFLVPKTEGKWKLILNLKALNQFVTHEHFKKEDIRCVKDLINQGDHMCKLDLKDAYLSIPIHKSSRKFLKFHWQGVAYEYTALPFGLSAAPRTFTKVLKPVLAALRAKGIRLVAYLDDILNIGKDKECAEEAFQTTKSLLQALGFVVNLEKSQSQATQEIEFLGFIINSREMTFRIPTARVKQIKNDTKRILQKEQVTVRELAHIVGVLASTRLAVLSAPLHYRALQGQRNEGLHHHLSYESMVTLSSQSREDLQWWTNHLSRNNGRPIHHPPPNMVTESDASDTGWGACYEGLTTRGQWSREESRLHINCKELLAAFLAVQTFAKNKRRMHIRLRVDNTTAMYYINIPYS